MSERVYLRFNRINPRLDALDIFDNGTRTTEGATATAGIWSTYPFSDGTKSISNWAGFGDQVNQCVYQISIMIINDFID